MGIDALNKAAQAAGFAMAAPDEDMLIEARPTPRRQAGTAVAVVKAQPEAAGTVQTVRAAVTSAANWVKGVVPSFGGGAPA